MEVGCVEHDVDEGAQIPAHHKQHRGGRGLAHNPQGLKQTLDRLGAKKAFAIEYVDSNSSMAS